MTGEGKQIRSESGAYFNSEWGNISLTSNPQTLKSERSVEESHLIDLGNVFHITSTHLALTVRHLHTQTTLTTFGELRKYTARWNSKLHMNVSNLLLFHIKYQLWFACFTKHQADTNKLSEHSGWKPDALSFWQKWQRWSLRKYYGKRKDLIPNQTCRSVFFNYWHFQPCKILEKNL